jgi:uncharacterized lipoprotein YajG
LEPIITTRLSLAIRGGRLAMRILVLLICILCLEGCQREERQLRLDPPIADALDRVALMPNGIGGVPPEVYISPRPGSAL